ncbi:hypothetical protein BC628DRAFT_356748 [Trametes gibbosa]|nr:hypothetical protein BC628DRAFT_356748 [Trametes gibbosa]
MSRSMYALLPLAGNNDDALWSRGSQAPVSVGFASRVGFVWRNKVGFVRRIRPDKESGLCVGEGRWLNGEVVQSGASGRPPSDPHPRSEPLLVASHSERIPLLAVPHVLRLALSIPHCSHLHPLQLALLQTILRCSLLRTHSHASRILNSPHVAPSYSTTPPALVFDCLYL